MGLLDHPPIESAVTWDEADRLAEIAKDKDVLELGCDYGFSAVVMGRVARHVDTVDMFGDTYPDGGFGNHSDALQVARVNCRVYGVADRVAIHVGLFVDVVPRLRAARAEGWDLVFVDGVHDYPDVMRDAELALKVVRRPGLLAFHDYGRFTVTEALDDFQRMYEFEAPVVIRSLAVLPV